MKIAKSISEISVKRNTNLSNDFFLPKNTFFRYDITSTF